ncbi:MAG: DUF805 domain-containing protein [Fibromonadales bacterium]|nr:DUF805 domain-containing protein [Fibromonadales bacterium]
MVDTEKLSLWACYVKCLKNYVNFKGRARRREYWGFYLFFFIFSLVISIIGGIIGIALGAIAGLAVEGLDVFATMDSVAQIFINLLSGLYGLAMSLPFLAVLARRLHDIGKSGWWILILVIPIIIFIPFVILLVVLAGEGLSNLVIIFTLLALIIAVIVPNIIVFAWTLMDGERGENKYGPSPKYPNVLS